MLQFPTASDGCWLFRSCTLDGPSEVLSAVSASHPNNVPRLPSRRIGQTQTLATDPLSLSKSIITIMKVTAKRSRLVIDGEMMYDNVRVPFNYRTSIGVKGKVRWWW